MSDEVAAAVAHQLDAIVERVRGNFAAKHEAREAALAQCRDVIRLASLTIRAIHRDERETAGRLLADGRARLRAVRAALAGHPDIFYAGFVHDAEKEFAEAAVTVALVCGEPLPAPEDLEVEYAAYLNGLAEAVGELRRYLLDSLRHGDVEGCERYLHIMDEIYAVLVTIDYPDAITGGLRRSTDVARGILEKTRGDLTIAVRQRDLERQLAEVRADLAAHQVDSRTVAAASAPS